MRTARGELLGGDRGDRQIEAFGGVAERVIGERDRTIAQRDRVRRERPANRLRALRWGRLVARHRPWQPHAFGHAIQPHRESLELELFDLERLPEQRPPGNLSPKTISLEEGRRLAGAGRRSLAGMQLEAVQRHASTQQRQIDVGQLDSADQRLVDTRDDHRTERKGKHTPQRDEQHEADEEHTVARLAQHLGDAGSMLG